MALRSSYVANIGLCLALLVVACFAALGATDSDEAFAAWCSTWLHPAGMFLTAVVAFSRQGHRSLVGWALASGTAAGLLVAILYRNDPSPPSPSLADPLWLAVYPLAAAALIQQARRRALRLSSGSWIDGLTTAFLAASLWALVVLEPLRATATNVAFSDLSLVLAYPVADLLLFATLAAVWALHGWRLDRSLALFGGAILLYTVADSLWALRLAHGQEANGGLFVAAWLSAFVALSMTRPESSPSPCPRQPRSASVLPALLGLAGTGVLVSGALGNAEALPLALAGIATALAALRFAVTSIDNADLLTASRNEAATDPLTGLGNRRALAAELDLRLAGDEPFTYVCLDLNGFKTYNDRFGHTAGDALLAGMGLALTAATLGGDGAFRPGGDEFCALLAGRPRRGDPRFDAVVAALTEDGAGFSIEPSYGVVSLPEDIRDADAAQRLGDERMYGHKRAGRKSTAEEMSELLSRVVAERQPTLHEHSDDVVALALKVARSLGCNAEDLDITARAAEQHDVGKLATPDAILLKPGPLDENEWELVRQHTIVGERILAGTPALRPVARVVRSCHEHWDGSGYPDGLAGHDIPLAARIITMCDAYSAMVTDRAYRSALSKTEAVAELRRCAGTQFDPELVEPFIQSVNETSSPAGLPHLAKAQAADFAPARHIDGQDAGSNRNQ